jgi:hypothetical protein
VFQTCFPSLLSRLESELDRRVERAGDQRRHGLQAQPPDIFPVHLQEGVSFRDHTRSISWAALINAFHINFKKSVRVGLRANWILLFRK